jgi:hypothetical protein
MVKTTSRIDAPGDGDTVHVGPVQLAGVAFSGRRGIQAVEWSADGGRTWSPADLRTPLSPLTWVLWSATWMPAGEGVAILTVRARDGNSDLQTSSQAPSFPSGASGYHMIQVTVGR